MIWNSAHQAGQTVTTLWGSVIVPEGWKVEYSAQKDVYTATSPDYEVADLRGAEVGHNLNETAAGVKITIPNKGFGVGESIQNAAAYIAWSESYIKDCTNCVESKRVLFDTTPALFTRSTAQDHGGGADATTIARGVGVSVDFSFAEYTPGVRQIIDRVLASVSLQ